MWSTLQQVWDYAKTPRVIALSINQGVTYYLSALAVAIGFRMNLFNIGVDGQYRLAALQRRGGRRVVLAAQAAAHH